MSTKTGVSSSIVHNPTGEVLKEIVGAGPAVEEDFDLDGIPETELVRVGRLNGVTINMGDYNSRRVDVWIERPARNTPAGIRKVNDYIEKWLEAELEKAGEKIMAAPSGQSVRKGKG